MPVTRTSKPVKRQLTLTGKPAPNSASSTSTSKRLESSVEPVNTNALTNKPAKRQLTLTGKPAPNAAPSTSNSKRSKSSVERVYTDALLPIKPEFSTLIASRKKNHEYRKVRMRPTVERIWLYEVAPTSAITSVMVTSRPKVPGEVRDPSGVGNDDFDAGLKQSKYGYPVSGLYRLREPLVPQVMKEKYGLPTPQGLIYMPKKLIEDIPLDIMEKVF